jgi:hypothetical protein
MSYSRGRADQSIARSAPLDLAAPLPPRGLPDLAREQTPVLLDSLVEVVDHVFRWPGLFLSWAKRFRR